MARGKPLLDAIAAEDFAWVNLTSQGDGARPERLRAAKVSVDLFPLLGARPLLGPGFTLPYPLSSLLFLFSFPPPPPTPPLLTAPRRQWRS